MARWRTYVSLTATVTCLAFFCFSAPRRRDVVGPATEVLSGISEFETANPPEAFDSMDKYNRFPELWQPMFLPDHIQEARQDDPELIRHIRENWIIPPSSEPYNLKFRLKKKLVDYSQKGQSVFVDRILGERSHGFFLESGAGDGEKNSNSFFFERTRNWNGILVEPNVRFFKDILSRHRKSFKINACLSPSAKPMQVNFSSADQYGGITEYLDPSRINFSKYYEKSHLMQCLPIYSILRALDISHVDFWSLDVEMLEPRVLSTLPWDHVSFDVMTVERYPGAENQIRDITEPHGYHVVEAPFMIDVVLVRNAIELGSLAS